MDDAGLSNLTKTDLANWLYTNDYQEDIFPTLQWIRSYIPGVTNEVAQKILEIRDMEADAGKPYAQNIRYGVIIMLSLFWRTWV